jgi:hypothetical protein
VCSHYGTPVSQPEEPESQATELLGEKEGNRGGDKRARKGKKDRKSGKRARAPRKRKHADPPVLTSHQAQQSNPPKQTDEVARGPPSKRKKTREEIALKYVGQDKNWMVQHAYNATRWIVHPSSQQRLIPLTDQSEAREHWYNGEVMQAYSHLLMREQRTRSSVKHNNDQVILGLEDLIADRDAECEESEDRIRWTQTLRRRRQDVKQKKAANVYIPANVSSADKVEDMDEEKQ